jgi:hypothetical protein
VYNQVKMGFPNIDYRNLRRVAPSLLLVVSCLREEERGFEKRQSEKMKRQGRVSWEVCVIDTVGDLFRDEF